MAMTREEQKEIRELKKLIPIELRRQRKEFDLQFAHGYLYRFEGDFLYYAILSIPTNRIGDLSISIFVKPWVLNELYWAVQEMDLEEMRAQPKSFHVRGAFTMNDIFYQGKSIPYDKDNFEYSVHEALVLFDENIVEHKKYLADIHVLTEEMKAYNVSNLTKALVLCYEEKYKEALDILEQEGTISDLYTHSDATGTTAKDYLRQYLKQKIADNQ